MASLLNMSGGSLLKKGLPYDAEIEYLESTGTQYIDTGFVPDNSSGSYSKAMCITKQSNAVLFGVRQNANTDSRWWINYSTGLEISWNTWFSFNVSYVGVITEVENNFLNSRLGVINGTTYRTQYPTLANIQETAYLFIGHVGNTVTSPFFGRIYNVQFSKGNSVVHNFIPVRVGTTGYMYDKVSGQLFGNSGTGSFILGADKQ